MVDRVVDAVTLPQVDGTARDCYDLSGRRVTTPARGVYVRDGRKIVK